jgi:imidazole glycerol phosphate synthase subunit HisF
MMPLRRKLAAGFDFALIKNIEAEVNVPLQMSDF